jgi:hypothetical protein
MAPAPAKTMPTAPAPAKTSTQLFDNVPADNTVVSYVTTIEPVYYVRSSR